MKEFLVELYVSKADRGAVTEAAERLRRAGAGLAAERRTVLLRDTIFVPEDETCLVLVESTAVADVRECARRAGVPIERVVETARDADRDAGGPAA